MSWVFKLRETRDDDTEIVVEFTVTSWGREAQTYGPAERYYPAEAMEFEITNAWVHGGIVGADSVTLTPAEITRIETWFAENPPEEDEDPRL